MAPYFPCYKLITLAILLVFLSNSSSASKLSHTFYSQSCPQLFDIVRKVVWDAINNESRMGASLLRLHFHDCFVNGCDASILLDDTPSFTGEKNAFPNKNSVRGFNIVDNIKSAVEAKCPSVVSCADILAIAAMESVSLLGGPFWLVELGRRDAITASQAAANNNLPPPTAGLNDLVSKFNNLGLSKRDLVALSGGHTIGQAKCSIFRDRIYNETNIDRTFAQSLQANCTKTSGPGDNNTAPLDLTTPTAFDNGYFKDLVVKKTLLHSDQQLFNGDWMTDSIVKIYSTNPLAFYKDFAVAMIKMGGIRPLTGSNGEIRKDCRSVNN